VTSPKVTVGLPVYNGERYLAETLDSILAQDFEDFELLVSDNASTDGTAQILREYAERDPRVTVHRQLHNVGAAANYNWLAQHARGEYFKWAGYDDLLDPRMLTACVATLDGDPEVVLAYPETTMIDASGTSRGPYAERLSVEHACVVARVAHLAYRVNLCNACFGVMRTSVLRQTGIIRPFISSDITFLAEMAAQGRFRLVSQPLFFRRVHDGSSRQGDVTLAEVARWFDPANARGPRFPRVRLIWETSLALTRAPLRPRDSVASAIVFAVVYTYRRLRAVAGRARRVAVGQPLTRPEYIHRMRDA
jgi:glycosyltransferase involved in cell wall biosynthesis